MEKDALVVVFARNTFYQRLHFLALGAFALILIVIGILIGILIYVIRHPVHPVYFATDSVGRLIRVVPVTVPNMSTDDVITWTINAVERTYTTDFVNYRAQLQSAQRFFTPYGWFNYMKALTASNNLLALTQSRQIWIGKVVEKPKIITQGILAGAYAWKFEMPLLETYMTPPFDYKSRYSNALNLTVIVQRQPILQSDNGLGIVQLIASFGTPTNQPQTLTNPSAPTQ